MQEAFCYCGKELAINFIGADLPNKSNITSSYYHCGVFAFVLVCLFLFMLLFSVSLCVFVIFGCLTVCFDSVCSRSTLGSR